ncbi:MAG: hypothetical protein A4S09_08550 [Proteobacteria bacterium SG_bin7]|nr:MAG: hypothetical protein A4S09_08550 [Proteobacteria bacterium SG_bin7]
MQLKLETITHEEKFMGEKLESNKFLVFFGSRHTTWEVLPKLFPNLKFARLKQTHGNTVVQSPSDMLLEGDGHWTEKRNVALTIVTADCLPVMILDQHRIGAVHAGWRGIENQVLLKTLHSGFSKNLEIFIGPHIQKSSFEVGIDVSKKLIASTKNLSFFDLKKCVFPHTDPQKRYIDLSYIACAQLKSFGIDEKNIYLSGHDTFTNNDFSSYRRKESPTGRQVSFIAYY